MEETNNSNTNELVVTMPQILQGLQHLEEEASAQLECDWGNEKYSFKDFFFEN
jgi:hypothetical protein